MSEILTRGETIVAAGGSREVGEGVQRGLARNDATYVPESFEPAKSRASDPWPAAVAPRR